MRERVDTKPEISLQFYGCQGFAGKVRLPNAEIATRVLCQARSFLIPLAEDFPSTVLFLFFSVEGFFQSHSILVPLACTALNLAFLLNQKNCENEFRNEKLHSLLQFRFFGSPVHIDMTNLDGPVTSFSRRQLCMSSRTTVLVPAALGASSGQDFCMR